MTDPVLVERHGHTLLITLNRREALNSVNLVLALALGDALEEAEVDADVWVVVITGAGDKAFCAGGDLKALARGEKVIPDDERHGPWGWAGYANHPISKPTIAAVNGFALGGGTEIVCASDLVVAAEEALFGLPEPRAGIIAGAGGAFRLPRQLPRKVAMEMLFTGEPISARRALELGLVNRVVAQADVVPEALKLAARICRCGPLAVQATKRVALGIVNGRISSEQSAWELSQRETDSLLTTRDAQEGPKAFADKRAPVWEAR